MGFVNKREKREEREWENYMIMVYLKIKYFQKSWHNDVSL